MRLLNRTGFHRARGRNGNHPFPVQRRSTHPHRGGISFGAWGVVLLLLVSVCALQAGCMYGKQDDSEEGRAAIRLVMNYKVPLGYLIHNCIEDYLYDREKKELRIERVGWVAYRRPYLQAGHRVSYRFNERGRELEARWIADIKTGKVEPENELARTIMKLN